MRRTALILLLFLASSVRLAFPQSTYTLTHSTNLSVNTCNAWIYDEGGQNGEYQNSSSGSIIIRPTTQGSMITIVEGSYDLENDWDFVYIYSGAGTSGALLATLTGSNMTLTESIMSTDVSGALTIVFSSDGSVCSYDGFAFHVQCVTPVSMSSATIQGCGLLWADPGGPGNYSNNQNVTQTICAGTNEHLVVDFQSFSLANGDMLYVYDGDNVSATSLGSYSGNNLPPALISSGSCLTFQFISNNTVVSSGWQANISCKTCTPASTSSGSPCIADNIHPFCTDANSGQYEYNSGTTGDADAFFGITSGYLGCIGIAPAPAWYFMRIDNPGDITIHIAQVSTTGSTLDVDFACWGPFAASSSAEFVENLCCGYYSFHTERHNSNTGFTNNTYNLYSDEGHDYPYGNLVDCSYDPATTEDCHITNARAGEYYLLMITNYDGYNTGATGIISFNSTAGSTASTDCSLMAEVSNDGPYCVGDTIHLFCNNPQDGAVYHWTGPNGWTSEEENPVVQIPVTTAMDGDTYTLVKTLNGVSSDPASTTIDVIEVNTTITPSSTIVCPGSSVTLTGSSLSGYQNGYSWSPGGQSTQTITVYPTSATTYTLTQTVSGCEGTASVTINVRQPQHQSYYVDTCAASYRWTINNHIYSQSGNYTASHMDAYGCRQVDTLHLNLISPSFSPPNDVHSSVQCAHDVHAPSPLPTVTSCGEDVELQFYEIQDHIQGSCGYVAYVYHYTVDGTQYTWNYFYHLHPSAYTVPHNQVISVQCMDDVEAPEPPVVINSCGDTIVPVAQPLSQGFDGCAGYVAYSWKYADCDGHSSVWKCTYQVEDTIRPVFNVPEDMHLCRNSENNYNADVSETGEPTGLSDNCVHAEDLSVDFSDVLVETAENVADTILRTWMVADDCGNANTQIQRIIIHPIVHVTVEDEICQGEQYNDLNFSFIARNDTTVTVTATTSETGCDSTLTLHLTVHEAQNTHITLEECGFYQWGDSLCTESGDYVQRYETNTGCDSLVILHLTVHPVEHQHIVMVAHDYYEWHDSIYTESGLYQYAYSDANGCDLVDTLSLTVYYSSFTEITDTVCGGYIWNDQFYDVSGDYEQVFANVDGADSTVILHLAVYNDHDTVIYRDVCDSYESEWGGEVFTTSGEHEYHLETVHGCDSMVTLVLTVRRSTASELDSAICVSELPLLWNGVTFREGGSQQTTLPNAVGCDSIVTMHLAVHPNTASVLYDTIVENLLPYDTLGMHFTEAGTMSDTIANGFGCDSVVTMHLTVLENVGARLDSAICENELPLQWNSMTFTQAGTQSVTLLAENGADSVVMMTLHVNVNTQSIVHEEVVENNLPHTFNSRVYDGPVSNDTIVISNANGCDSVILYSLRVWNNVTDTIERTIC